MSGHGASSTDTDRDAIEGVTEEQSRLFLETMVACAPVGLAVVDLELRYIHINEALAAINGLPRHAHLGRKLRDVVPELWPILEPHCRGVLETGQPVLNLEITGTTPLQAGVIRQFLVSYYPLRDGSGVMQGVGITVVETTENRRAHQALRASEQRYRSLVEATAQTVWTTNAHGELMEPAPRWQAFTGQSLGAHLGLGWLDAIHPDDRKRFATEWAAALKTRDPYQGELRLTFHDGTYRHVVVRSVPVFDDAGGVREWISTAEDITERKHAEGERRRTSEALRQGEQRYRTFVSQSTEGIWRMEITPPIDTRLPEQEQVRALLHRGSIAEANEVMARMTGFGSAREMVGVTLHRLIQQLTHADTAVEEAVLPFVRNGYRMEGVETRLPGPDGMERVRLANLMGVVENGRLVRIWGTQRDVTDRVRAKAEVEAQRARLYDVLMNIPAAIALLRGPELAFDLVNPIYQGLTHGVSLTGQSLRDLTRHHRTAEEYFRTLRGVYESGRPHFQMEVLIQREGRGSGALEDHYFNIAYVPLRDAEGRVDSVLSFSMDVTEMVRARQRAEELAAHLSNQQQWLETVLNLIPIAFVLMEPGTGRVHFANQATHRMAGGRLPLGLSAEDYGSVYPLVDEEGSPIPIDRVPGMRAARGERLQQETVGWDSPLGRRLFLTDSELLPAMHGHPATIVLSIQEVTRLKQTEARLQEAVRLRDEFLTVASHELKTPLTPLQLKLQGLVREARTGDSLHRLQERVLRTAESASAQVRKLTALINDLLDATQLTGETLTLHRERVDLSAVLRDVAEQFRSQAAQAGCELVVRAPEPVVGFWDRHRLEQVARGLLSNAIRYGPGRPVWLTVERRGGVARFSVRDEGIGIPPENLPRIFEKFVRAVPARNYGGLGLGLFITRCIVESHQGSIHAQSRPGEGAVFIVDLPLAMDGRPLEAMVH